MNLTVQSKTIKNTAKKAIQYYIQILKKQCKFFEEYIIQTHKLVKQRAKLTDPEPDYDDQFKMLDDDDVSREVSKHELEVVYIKAA